MLAAQPHEPAELLLQSSDRYAAISAPSTPAGVASETSSTAPCGGTSRKPLQAKVIADYLCGEVAFPDADTMRREMMALQEATDKRFVKSTRHTMEVDFVPFLHALKKLRSRGRALAKARGTAQPIAAKAT